MITQQVVNRNLPYNLQIRTEKEQTKRGYCDLHFTAKGFQKRQIVSRSLLRRENEIEMR